MLADVGGPWALSCVEELAEIIVDRAPFEFLMSELVAVVPQAAVAARVFVAAAFSADTLASSGEGVDELLGFSQRVDEPGATWNVVIEDDGGNGTNPVGDGSTKVAGGNLKDFGGTLLKCICESVGKPEIAGDCRVNG